MTGWDGNINNPHTMQDEYELRQQLGASALTTDDDGQMIAVYDPESVPTHPGPDRTHAGYCSRCRA